MNLKELTDSNMRKRNYKCFMCACVLVYIYYFFGVGDYIYSRNFDDDFDYPLNIDIKPLVRDIMAGKKLTVPPINIYPYKFLTNSAKCKTLEKLDLFIIVKSAMNHFSHRQAIRHTYGQENFIPGTIVKTLFFLGIDESHPKSETQKAIEIEMKTYKDIIQIGFHDHYYNNTIKTMMSFRWVYEHCPSADYYLFTDDDMYISVNNLLDYVHDRAFEDSNEGDNVPVISNNNAPERDVHLLAGYVFNSAPLRYRNNKWRVSYDEYPWNRWPPYATAGAYVISNASMKLLYVGSLFVKHFRFDDIYLAIVAKKVGIMPKHCKDFHFYKLDYTKEGYKDVIASHGYDEYDELVRVWNEQNNMNNLR